MLLVYLERPRAAQFGMDGTRMAQMEREKGKEGRRSIWRPSPFLATDYQRRNGNGHGWKEAMLAHAKKTEKWERRPRVLAGAREICEWGTAGRKDYGQGWKEEST